MDPSKLEIVYSVRLNGLHPFNMVGKEGKKLHMTF